LTAPTSLRVPDGYERRHPEEPGWVPWVSSLPDRVADACAEFGLVVADGTVLAGAEGAVVRCVDAAGDPAALKVGFGGWAWTAGEAAALTAMCPHTARVLADDWVARRVMALEWVSGPRLADLGSARARAGVAGRAVSLTAVARDHLPVAALAVLDGCVEHVNPTRWAKTTEARFVRVGRPEHLAGHVDAAARVAGRLDTAGIHLINVDLSFDNILKSPSGWKVIDPEPAWGPPAAAAAWPAAILARSGDPEPVLALADAAGLPVATVAAWAYIDSVVHALWYPPTAPHLWGNDPDRDHAGVACDTLHRLLARTGR